MLCLVCSAKYALRPYLYLLLHTTVTGPAALWFGSGAGDDAYGASTTMSTVFVFGPEHGAVIDNS